MSKTIVKAGKQARTPKKRASDSRGFQRNVTFRSAAAEGSEVFVAGTFNDWDPRMHQLTPDEGGGYSTTLRLPRGTHQYKLVINDVWCVDPGCEHWTPNGVGSLNSVLKIL